MILKADIIGTAIIFALFLLFLTAMVIDRDRDPLSLDAGPEDPGEHLEPLRQATPAESAYDTRMQRRGQFLSHQFVKPRRAAALAQKVTRRALAARRGATSPAPLSAPEAASPSVPSVSGTEDEAPTMNVPGRETGAASPPPATSSGHASGGQSHATAHATDPGEPALPAGDLPAKRPGAHRQPRPQRRWRGVGGYFRSPVGAPSRDWKPAVPAWAYAPIPGPVGTALPPAVPVAAMVLSAPPPDSPARETPAPRPEPSGAPGQGLAPGDEPEPYETDEEYIASVAHLLPVEALADEVIVLCAGCLGSAHCDGKEWDCDCTCGLPPAWAEDGAAGERLANTAERDAIDAGADWDLPWTAHAAAPVPVVDHEQAPATEEAPAELPGAEDCDPEPLFSDDNTIWRGLKALKVEAGEAT